MPYFTQALEHIVTNKVQGDYLEFGVFDGQSLIMAYQVANRSQATDMRFFGFDSFQGLPESDGIRYLKGTLKSSMGNTVRHLRRVGVDMRRIELKEGIFSRSLNKAVKDQHKLRHAAIVHIDCDLYSSTKDVLAFVEDLVGPGTVMIFDDWDAYRKTETPEELGEQKAFREWPLHTIQRVLLSRYERGARESVRNARTSRPVARSSGSGLCGRRPARKRTGSNHFCSASNRALRPESLFLLGRGASCARRP